MDKYKYITDTLGHPLKELLRFPKFFLIEVTNICNALCIMCGIDFEKKKKAVMTDELFDKILGEIAQYGQHVEKVMLYLDCEPLLDKKLPLRIKKAKNLGIKKVNIASNASLLNQAKAEEIINAGLDEIYITLDSLKKNVFESIRPGLKFEDVHKNILGFIQARNKLNPKLVIRVQMIMQESNHTEGDAFIQYWKKSLNSSDQVVVQRAHNWGKTVDVMEFGDEADINNIPCIALWGTMAIHVDGKTGLCCMDTDNTLTIGDVSRESIAKIWAGEVLERVRSKHISAQRPQIALCNGCTLWRPAKHNQKLIVENNE